MISSELLPPWCLLEMARLSLLTSATVGQGPALCWCPVGWGPPLLSRGVQDGRLVGKHQATWGRVGKGPPEWPHLPTVTARRLLIPAIRARSMP